MVTRNGESHRPHSFGPLYRFLYSRTSFLSWRYRQSCSQVVSAHANVLGGDDDSLLRARRCGPSYESHCASRRSLADHDARALWPARVDTVAPLECTKLYELERNHRNFRDCRSRMDSRRSPRQVVPKWKLT